MNHTAESVTKSIVESWNDFVRHPSAGTGELRLLHIGKYSYSGPFLGRDEIMFLSEQAQNLPMSDRPKSICWGSCIRAQALGRGSKRYVARYCDWDELADLVMEFFYVCQIENLLLESGWFTSKIMDLLPQRVPSVQTLVIGGSRRIESPLPLLARFNAGSKLKSLSIHRQCPFGSEDFEATTLALQGCTSLELLDMDMPVDSSAFIFLKTLVYEHESLLSLSLSGTWTDEKEFQVHEGNSFLSAAFSHPNLRMILLNVPEKYIPLMTLLSSQSMFKSALQELRLGTDTIEITKKKGGIRLSSGSFTHSNYLADTLRTITKSQDVVEFELRTCPSVRTFPNLVNEIFLSRTCRIAKLYLNCRSWDDGTLDELSRGLGRYGNLTELSIDLGNIRSATGFFPEGSLKSLSLNFAHPGCSVFQLVSDMSRHHAQLESLSLTANNFLVEDNEDGTRQMDHFPAFVRSLSHLSSLSSLSINWRWDDQVMKRMMGETIDIKTMKSVMEMYRCLNLLIEFSENHPSITRLDFSSMNGCFFHIDSLFAQIQCIKTLSGLLILIPSFLEQDLEGWADAMMKKTFTSCIGDTEGTGSWNYQSISLIEMACFRNKLLGCVKDENSDLPGYLWAHALRKLVSNHGEISPAFSFLRARNFGSIALQCTN